MKSEQPLFDDVAMNETYLKKDVISDKSVKNVQFAKPYFQRLHWMQASGFHFGTLVATPRLE